MRIRIWFIGILVPVIFCFFPDRISARTGAQQSDTGLGRGAASDPGRSREIHRRDCLVCHGANGDGKTDILRDRELNLPDWTDPKSLRGRLDKQLFSTIRLGRGRMPAESVGRADDAEVRDLIHFIRTMARDEAVVTPGTGAAVSIEK